MSRFQRDDNRIPVIGGTNTGTGSAVPISSILAGTVNTLPVAIVDGSGVQITSFGGGTQYIDAAAAAANPTGTGIIFNNAGTYNFVSAAQPLPVTGSLTVGGTADNSAFTAGTTTGTPSMGFYHSVIDSVTDGRAAALAIDAKRNLFVVIRDAAGNARGLNIDASGQLAVTGTFWQATQPVSGTFWQSTQPVSIATAPVLVAGSAIIGKVGIDQTTPGTTNGVQVNAALPAGTNVIGHVIADTGSTTAVTGNVATTVADGVNVTLGAKADAKSAATDTTAISVMSVLKQISASVQAPPSQAVTNAGTFAVQATLSAETTKVIGTVNVAASQTIAVTNTGTFAVQATPVTQADTFMLGGVNIKEINGVAPLMGNGATGTGALRVATTSDGTLGTVTTVSTLTNQSQEGGVAISLNAGAVDTGTRRVIQANGAGKTIVSASGSASTSGNNTLVAAGTNKLKVFAFTLSTSSTTAITVKFQSGASGTDLWSVILQAPTSVSTGANLAVSPPAWLFATASATLLNLNLSSANAVQWSVSYYDEA